jgi:hypothetical protein
MVLSKFILKYLNGSSLKLGSDQIKPIVVMGSEKLKGGH